MLTLADGPKPHSARAGANASATGEQGNRKRKPGKASRAAKPKRPAVRNGRPLDDDGTLADQRAWLDW